MCPKGPVQFNSLTKHAVLFFFGGSGLGQHGRVMQSSPALEKCPVSELKSAMIGVAVCAVRKVGYFGSVFHYEQGDHSNYCVPRHRTTQILTQSKNSDNDLKQTVFHTENARLLSESAVFAFVDEAPPLVGGFQGGNGKADLLLGAVHVLYRNAPVAPRYTHGTGRYTSLLLATPDNLQRGTTTPEGIP